MYIVGKYSIYMYETQEETSFFLPVWRRVLITIYFLTMYVLVYLFKLQCHVCKKLLNLCTKSQKTFNNLVEFLIGCLQGVPCLTSVCRVFHVWPVSAGCSMFDQCLQGVPCLTSVFCTSLYIRHILYVHL
jgi:hypothetical protein